MARREWIVEFLLKNTPESDGGAIHELTVQMYDVLERQTEAFVADWAESIVLGHWKTAERKLLKELQSQLLAASYDEVLEDWRAANVIQKADIAQRQVILQLLARALITYALALVGA